MLPGWNSLETTSSIHRFFELGVIFLFGVMVMFEFVSYVYNQRKESLADELHRHELAIRDERVSTAEKKVAELLDASRQREISSEQRARLLEVLRPFVGGKMLISEPHNDAEAGTYAKQLDEVLEAAGIKLEHVIAADFDQTPYGLTLHFKQGPSPAGARQLAFQPLLDALRSAGLDVDVGPDDRNAPVGVVEPRRQQEEVENRKVGSDPGSEANRIESTYLEIRL